METTDKIIVNGVSFSYGRNQVLTNIYANFQAHTLTAITGPSGQGKSTLLGIFNCMWNEIPGVRCTGKIQIRLGGQWISPQKKDISLPLLRQKVAMIFQEPNPLPMSIAKNMAFPLKLAGVRDKSIIEEKIQAALIKAFLWEEVKDRLEESALNLSGGQKQRLCIARALVLGPEVLLCDEPTSSLDSKAAGIIEELLVSLKANCTLLVVSHYMDQVRRIGDQVMALEDQGLIRI
ncbi:MAG: ATP-binding cassette domain-containing protein [Deltaproteobacteria bacterium]|nr:ATP-binding cassette domain-containing protein [Deltaproteobacteria bacterium]